MARPRQPRLSIEPLLTTLALNSIEPSDLPVRMYAELRRAKMNGCLPLNWADEIACTVLSMHPFFIWGDEYEERVWFDMHDEDTESVVIAVDFGRKTAPLAVAA